MNRGDRREAIFQDDADRERFLATLAEACGKSGGQAPALCLMPNPFPSVVETMGAHAEGIVAAELKRRRWMEAALGRRAKGDAGKVAMALCLRAERAVTVRGMAERLRMGRPGQVNHLRYRERKDRKGK